MSWQVGLYLTAILAPMLAFIVEIMAGRRLGRRAGYLATSAIGFSFVLSVIGLVVYVASADGMFRARSNQQAQPLAWRFETPFVALGAQIPATEGKSAGTALSIPIGIEIDNLTVVIFLMITFVATVVHVFALGYLRDDPRFPRFFAYLSLFCASMLALVVASNLFFVFVCWELVGFCSYLLIGFWQEESANVGAANKAFLVNRVGDVGLLLGLGLLWANLGTLDLRTINDQIRGPDGQLNVRTIDGQRVVCLADPSNESALTDPTSGLARQIPYGLLILAGLGIFAGCVGKSAQFPLHVWLPDAMAGPTPVSALIHAATMVAAGVYLVGRVFPIFTAEVLLAIAYTGAITLIIAGSIAMVESDFKKVLAYSTVSQLGFMMVGLGVGGRSAGLFHLLTHGCFKALLFLGAGSLYHSVHSYQLADLGGLHHRMKRTSLTMLAATLAIAGVPFFSGFASKDAILASTLHFVIESPQHLILFILPVIGATITAFYMFRLWFLIFAGRPRTAMASEAHEGDGWLTGPLIALAIPTIALGWPLPGLGFKPVLEQWLEYGEPLDSLDPGSVGWWTLGASILVLAIGYGLGALHYGPWESWRKLDPRKTASRFHLIHEFLVHRWYFDELYARIFVKPILALTRAIQRFDRTGLDGLVDGSAWSTRQLSRFEGIFDRIAVDGLVILFARGTYAAGDQFRRIQNGSIRTYLLILASAVIAIGSALFAWVLA